MSACACRMRCISIFAATTRPMAAVRRPACFWKEAWLKRVGEEETKLPSIANLLAKTGETGCTESDVWRATKHGLPGAPIYSCQATELLTSRLR